MSVMWRIYTMLMEPCSWLLDRVVSVTGWSATHASRVAIWTAVAVRAVDETLHPDFFTAFDLLSAVILLVWALRRVKVVEQGSCETILPLSDWIRLSLAATFWGTLGLLLVFIDPLSSLSCLLDTLCCCWIPHSGGGGKSVWTRAKDSLRSLLPRRSVPVGAS
jgi:hypothetical protein